MRGQDTLDHDTVLWAGSDGNTTDDEAATLRSQRRKKREAESRRFSRSLREAEQRREDDDQPSDSTILTVASLAMLALLHCPRWFSPAASKAVETSADCLTADNAPMITASEGAGVRTSALPSYYAEANDIEQSSGGPSEVATEADQVSKHAIEEAIKGFQFAQSGDPLIVEGKGQACQGGVRGNQEGDSR